MVTTMAGSRSTRMSISLSGRSSPRATEPNSAAWATPCARKSASRSFSFLMISSRVMTALCRKEGKKTRCLLHLMQANKGPCSSVAWLLRVFLEVPSLRHRRNEANGRKPLSQRSRHRPHPLGGEIVGGEERLQRQFRQRDIDRRAENHGGGDEAQDFAVEPHLEGDRDVVRRQRRRAGRDRVGLELLVEF